MPKARTLKCLFLSATMLSGGTACAQAVAGTPAEQTAAPGQPAPVQEIIVTAQKRSERLNDVPLSITAVTGNDLAKQGVTSVADLQKVAPGFTYRPSDYGSPVYTIRGIGFFDNSVTIAPAVSVYVDQVPLPYSIMTSGATLDLARVEVLKGPQGTLFGENSTGGAINYIANKPTRQLDAGLNLSYGSFNDTSINGFVSGPISDTLSARLALSTDQSGAWQRSETRDATLGRRNFSSGRFLLDWKPLTSLRVELGTNGWIDKSENQAAQFVSFPVSLGASGYQDLVPGLEAYKPAPNNNRVADWDPDTSFRRNDNFYQVYLRADWDITDAITLTSLTAYSGLKQYSPTDSDGTALDDAQLTLQTAIHSVSQELRLSGQALGDRLKWMVGGNFENDITKSTQTNHYHGSNSGVGPLRAYDPVIENNQNVDTSAVFASVDYKVTDTISFQASTRFTRSDDSFNGCLRDSGDGTEAAAFSLIASSPIAPGGCLTLTPPPGLTPVPLVYEKLDQSNLSWRAGASWKPNAGTLLYANVTHGYKAGSFPAVPALFASQLAPVNQESVIAYEIGFKKDLFAKKLQINGAGFYDNYTNKQTSSYVLTAFGDLPSLVNIPKSSVKGGEIDVIARLFTGLKITAGGTYVGTRVDQHFVAFDPFGAPVDIKGETFPGTPAWQLSGDAEYDFPITNDLSAFAGAGVRHQSSSFAAFGEQPEFRIAAYTLLDLRAGVESPNGHWRAEIWGKNVTNQFYVQSVTRVIDTVSRYTGLPASFGITIGYKYR